MIINLNRKHIKRTAVQYLGILFCIVCATHATAQTFSAHQNFPIGSNSNGFYDYLPLGYDANGSQKYPLLIAFHGADELGNGNTQLVRLTNNGLPQLIKNNKFPPSFTVSSGTYSFIVFAPQFIVIPGIDDIDAVIKYAMTHYAVDLTRVYVTGYSMGGGAVWEYSGYAAANGNLFAAIVPVSGALPGPPDLAVARTIASDNLPVWATHNLSDPIVPSSNTTTMIGYINQAPAPVPKALMTIFTASTHDAWTKTYNPLYIDPNTGFNMYNWMLQYQSRPVTLPVTISNYAVSLQSDRHVQIDWSTSEEENNLYFTIEKSTDGIHFAELTRVTATNNKTGSNYSFTDEHPVAGNNYYRLSQTDSDNRRTFFQVKEITLDSSFLPKIIASPNPVTAAVFVQLNFPQTGDMNLRILSAAGIQVKTLSFQKPDPHWEKWISLSDLAGGMYILEVEGAAVHLHFQLIKN